MGKLILKWAIVLTIATGITVINGVHENEKAERRDNPPKYGRVTLPYDYRDKSLSDYGIKVPKGQTYTGVSVDGNDPYDIEAGIEDLQRQIKELQSKRVTTRKQLRELKEQKELEKYLGL